MLSATCLLLAVLLVLLSRVAFGSHSRLKFERLSLEEGISHNLVYALIQDRQGFMWFGTMYGLVRYDGQRYRTFRHVPGDSTSLSYDDIISLYEDSRGHIWVGTWGGGLNRFDPLTETFTRYPATITGVAEKHFSMIWSITETMGQDNERRIWLAADRHGLLELSPDADSLQYRQHTPQAVNSRSLASHFVRKVYTDSNGSLWIGGNSGLSYLKFTIADSLQFQNLQHIADDPAALPARSVNEILEDRTGNLWIGTPAGLSLLTAADRPSGRFSRHFRHNASDPFSLAGDDVNAIREDAAGDLWIATPNGLSRLPLENRDSGIFINEQHDPENPHSLPANNILTLCEDRSGVIWVSVYHSDLCRIVPNQQKFLHYGHFPGDGSSASQNVSAVLADAGGSIWVGTSSGVNHIFPDALLQNKHSRLPISIPGDSLASFPLTTAGGGKVRATALAEWHYDDKRLLWIGTAGSGIYLWDISGKIPRQVQHFFLDGDRRFAEQRNHITALLADTLAEPAVLWAGTTAGLAKLPLGDGTIAGQQIYLPHRDSTTTLPHYWVLSLFQQNDGTIWVGSYGGLSRYQPESDDFRSYCNQRDRVTSLSNNYVYAIHESRHRGQSVLWVGTSGGLNRFDPATGESVHFTEKDGLPNAVICGILEDEQGKLWLSTQKGLTVFDPLAITMRHFTLADGIQSNIFSPGVFAQRRNGEMLFGGINGLNRFHPQNIVNNEFTATPTLINFSVNERPLPQAALNKLRSSGTVTLSYEQNFLQIDVAALNFTQPQNNHIRYRLNGIDQQWHFSRDFRISYPALPPGDYQLAVQAANADGVWHPTPLWLEITITPPFWQTGGFFTLAAILIVCSVLTIHHRRVRQQVRQAELLAEARQAERLLVREQTARDYHDQLGHQVAKISLFGELMRREISTRLQLSLASSAIADSGDSTEGGSGTPLRLLRYLQKISDAANRLSTDTRDFIWALNPEKDSLYDTAIHLQNFAETLFDDTEIRFSVHGVYQVLSGHRLSMDERRNLVLLFKEALTNILKHAGCSEVLLSFDLQEDGYEIRLSDDGVGLEKVDLDSGNGFRNMKKRAEMIGGILKIISQPGEGIVLVFTHRRG